MKKTLFVLLFVLLGTVLMAEERNIDIEMQNLDHMVIPIRFDQAGINVGASVSGFESIFPIVNVTIPFGGDYLILGGIGAGKDPMNENDLSLFSVGFGYKNRFPNIDLFNYLISLNIKTYQSTVFENTSLTGEFDVEQKVDDNVMLGFGILFGIQHYSTNESSIFGMVDDRTLSSLLKVSISTPYVNFQAKGSLNMISLGLSFTLNMDE